MIDEGSVNEAVVYVLMSKGSFDSDLDLEVTVEIKTNKADHLLIEVTSMYYPPDIGIEDIHEIAKKLNFSYYEKYDEISNEGCETCDYGSSYGYALRFWN